MAGTQGVTGTVLSVASLALVACAATNNGGASQLEPTASAQAPAPQQSAPSLAPSTPDAGPPRSLPDDVVAPTNPPLPPVPMVREERDVRVGTALEHWRIQWRRPPVASDSGGCWLFEHALRGQADVIRSRAGRRDEVFSLSTIYDRSDFYDPVVPPGEALLPTWPLESNSEATADRYAVRRLDDGSPLIILMDLKDYDHDGEATEFILPIGGVGCVFSHFVAVGISRRIPRLHVLGTAKHPYQPLAMSYRGWRTLENGSGSYVSNGCGNHGGEEQWVDRLWTDRDGIHGLSFVFDCSEWPILRELSRTEW